MLHIILPFKIIDVLTIPGMVIVDVALCTKIKSSLHIFLHLGG